MKRLGFGFLILTLWMAQACSGNNKNDTSASTDTITNADSLNALKNSQPEANIKPEDQDLQFTVDAASGGLTEIELGKLAQQKGSNKRVKNFGAMMIKDHSKSNIKLMKLAKSKKIAIPTVPLNDDQKIIDELSKKSGSDFDKAYVADMIADHQKDIREFENASKNSNDPDIKAFANKTLTILKNHLDAINTINSSMH